MDGIQQENNLNEPLLVLTPKNRFLLLLANAMWLSVLFGVFGGVFFGALFASAGGFTLWQFFFFGLIFFFATPLFLLFLQKNSKNFDRSFRFYENEFEQCIGIFSQRKIRTRYSAIDKVELKKGLIQKIYGVGTVLLHTGETATWITDIENPDENFRKVKEILGK